MTKKNKKEINLETLFANLFICFLLLCLVVILLYYFLFYGGTVHSKTWDVHFSRIINKECSYDSKCTTPTIYTDSATTGDYTVEFSQPNQKAVYEIEVVNNGILDAEVTNIIMGTPHCKGNADNSDASVKDASLVCSKLKYTLLDSDNNKVVPGNTLKSGEKKIYNLVLTYDDYNYFVSEDERLTDSVTVRNLNLTVDFSQVK